MRLQKGKVSLLEVSSLTFFSIFFIIIIAVFVLANISTISFVSPTPANGSSQTATSIYVNVSSTTNLGNHYTFVDFDKSLVGWWRMDDRNASGGIVDLSKSSINATLPSSVVINSTGLFGNASWFNGSSGINLADPSSLNMSISNAFTISAWVYPADDTNPDSVIFARGAVSSSGDQMVYWFGKYSSGATRYQAQISNGTDYFTFVTTAGDVVPNTWQHIALTFNGDLSNATLYKNGVFIGGQTLPGFNRVWDAISDSQRITGIGYNARQGGSTWNGSIDEVIVFNRSLNLQEIKALYNATANQYFNNFTNLSIATHTFTAYAVDTNGSRNQTDQRVVTVISGSDTTVPVVTLVAPANNTYISLAVNSFNATFTDDVNVSNATLYIWNITGATINTTVRALSGTSASANITFSFPYNGTFYWNYRASDNSSNTAFGSTSNFTINYDALAPFINYTSPTEANSTNLSRSYVLINVTATDTNLANITINLYNITSLVNSTTTSTSPNYVNITVPRNGIYYFNATATDLANNRNSTATRTVNVSNVDATAPVVTILSPTSTNYTNNSIIFNVTLDEDGYVQYSLNAGLTNLTMSSVNNRNFNATNSSLGNGTYTFSVFANDTSGNWNRTASVLFTVNTSFTVPTDTTPPTVNFSSPTPANATSQSANAIYVNVTSTDSSGHYTFVDFDKSLVGWWRMDDRNSSGGVADLSSFSINGSLEGGAVINATGRFGNATWLNGSQDINLGQPDLLNMSASNAFTISAWVYPRSNPERLIFSRGADSSVDNFIYLFGTHSSGTRYRAQISNGTDYILLLTGAGDVAENTWQHVVLTYSSVGDVGNATIYKNGSFSATATLTGFNRIWDGAGTAANRNTGIGFAARNPGGYWNGSIDEVIVFNRSLSLQEIRALYNATANQYFNNFTGLSQTTHTFTAYAVDTYGNKNQTEQRSVSIQTNPVISIYSPLNTTYSNLTILVNFTAADSDGISMKWFYNGSGNTTYTSEVTQTVVAGQRTFIFYANDTLNNLANTSVTFIANSSLDVTAPTVTINSPTSGQIYRNLPSNINFTVTLNENGTVRYTLNSGLTNFTMSNATSSLIFNATNTTLPEGNYNVFFYANDTSGNTNYTTNVSFVVNKSYGNATQIDQWGITFFLNQSVPYGQFANGDFWVKGPLNITNITPAYQNHSFNATFGARVNGWEANPRNVTYQGFDERAFFFNASYVPNLPFNATGNISIVKADSWEETNTTCQSGPVTSNGPCLYTASVLTVLDHLPAGNGNNFLRPNYFGVAKTFYNASLLDTSMFPVLANVSSMPNFSTILNDFQRVHLDHQIGYYSQFIRPDQNLPEYPADYALETSEAALRFITYGNGSEKQAALIGYAQSGIDHYHMALGGTVWDPNGGYGNGRKMPVLFAGIVLNNSNIMNWTMNSTSVMPTIFGEEGHMYFGRNIGLYGTWYQASDSGYWNNVVNDVGGRDIRDPYNYIDGGERPAGSYQPIVSNPSIPSLLLLLSYPRARTLWNNDSFVYYNLRYFNNGGFTSFDICAPADGLCVGGSNNGGYCNTAGENGTSCGTDADTQSCNSYCGGGGYCNNSASWSNYNLTYGLNATTNTCIVDSNLADGIGRFPGRNRFNDTSAYSSTFGQAMWGQNIQGYFNDTSAPTSIIVSPSNGSTVTSNTTFFAINLTDTGGLARSLLYVWNSTGSLIRYNYSEISGNNTLVNRSVVLPSTGVYYWNYYTTDMYGNQRFNNSNYTVTFSSAVSDTTSPVVNLVAPTNNTYVSLAVNSFNATFTDDVNVSNATLYIWNVTGATINTTVRALSGTSASANITFSFPYNGTFYWNYRASDNSSNAAMNSSNFTIVYDALSPFVNYTSPTENNSTNLSRSYVLINVTATDTNLANITINLFNTTSLINSTTTSTSPNYVNITVPRDGIYYFNATATDLANNKNSTSTRTVNVTVDTTSPSVSLNAPANNTLTSLSTQSFNATFADNLNLSNATLYIWNSTSGVVNNTNRTLTGTAASLNITVTLPYSDRFYWNYIVSDTVGNFASNHTNFTIVYDAVTPGVTLVAPANGSQSLINNVTFNATFTDNFALRNATLFIWNSSLAVINQTGRTINGTANGVNITVTLPYQGTFYWNYFAVDNATNSAMNSSNFTLIFNSTDTTSPVVTVNLPTATTYSSSTLAFNVSLNENGSVRFSLDNGVTNNSMTGDQGIFGTDFNYTQTSISNGDYVFRVYANDTVGNMNRTANVSFTVSVSSGSSGGGSGGGGGGDGGGGGASSSNATTIWIVTFNDTAKILDEQGVGRFLGRLERTLINISGKVHYVGVLSLTTLNASIEVASIPQKATLNIGQSKLFEVNEDNYYDLNVTILSIADSKAAISVTAIHLLIPGRVEENESVIGEPSESVEESDKGYMKYFNFVMENYIPFIVNNYLFFVIGFVVLLIIILIIIRRKNHTQNKIDGLVNRIAREHTHVNHHVTHPIHHVHSKEHSSVKSHIPEKHDKNSKK